MRLPRVQFTVRRMMIAVAVAAFLLPFPFEILQAMASALGFWVVFLIFAVWISESLGKGRAAIAVAVAVVGGLRLVPLVPTAWGLDALVAVGLGLTPLNLAGPLYAARRVFRSQPLMAGEILWGWLGVLWSSVLWGWHPQPVWITCSWWRKAPV